VTPAVATATGATTFIRITNERREIYNSQRSTMNQDRYAYAGVGDIYSASISGETLYLDRGPDKTYPLLWTFYQDIDQMTESSTLFTRILREWRNIFIEGVTLKSMILHDDNRQFEHVGIYKYMIDRLAAEAGTIEQTIPYDPIYQ
jgi:hypothetical protein